jgi:hypothetical protein
MRQVCTFVHHCILFTITMPSEPMSYVVSLCQDSYATLAPGILSNFYGSNVLEIFLYPYDHVRCNLRHLSVFLTVLLLAEVEECVGSQFFLRCRQISYSDDEIMWLNSWTYTVYAIPLILHWWFSKTPSWAEQAVAEKWAGCVPQFLRLRGFLTSHATLFYVGWCNLLERPRGSDGEARAAGWPGCRIVILHPGCQIARLYIYIYI